MRPIGTLRHVAYAAFLISVATSLPAQDKFCHTVTGDSFRGLLVKLADDGNFVFDTNTGTRTILPEKLAAWGSLSDTAEGTQIVLADGSIIVASAAELDGESLIVEANLFGDIEGTKLAGTSRLPLSAVKAIIFRLPLPAPARDALFDRINATQGNEDQIWLANGDRLSGTVNRLEPRAIGIATAEGPLVIEPAAERGRLLEKVTALVFNPLLVRPVRGDEARTLVGFADGSRLSVKQFKPDGERVALKLTCGATLKSHPDEDIAQRIASLQSLSSTVQYLSGLKPHGYRHTPLLDRTWALGVDKSVTGGQLRSSGHLFVRGIGMHSRSRVLFRLVKPFSRLHAELAVDESAGAAGSVRFIVATVIDGKVKPLYTSPVVRGGDAPLPISTDISGHSNLVLFITDADGGTQMDRANWLNARLIE